MTDLEYNNIIELVYMGGGWVPYNNNASELSSRCYKGEIISFKEITKRDLKFHRAYFSLLNFIWLYLPEKFKQAIPCDDFHKWLKHLQGNYKVSYTFKDGTKLIEYNSISFGNMSEKRFREYVAEQLPYIYENVLGAFFDGEMLKGIIETIEKEYEKFLNKL